VAQIRVHLTDLFVAVLKRPREAGAVGGAEPHPPCPLDDVDPRARLLKLVDARAGAVGRSVIHEQNVDSDVRSDRFDPSHERVDVVDLVVGRHNHDQLCLIRCQTTSLPYVTDRGVGPFSGQTR
jgi:hypothetical protein